MLTENAYCCPACHGDLVLVATEWVDANTESAPPLFREVLTGTLTCQGCGSVYPIENTAPLFLPPDVLVNRNVGRWKYA